MYHRSMNKNYRLFLVAVLVTALAISLAPVRMAYADTSTSDLAISLISAPKHVKACEIFEVTYRITNLGPDDATGIFVLDFTPDQLGTFDILGVPDSLAVGESATVIAIVKVVSFGPDDPRKVRIGAGVFAEPFPDTSIDPNLENNTVNQPLKLIGRPIPAPCP